MTKPQSAGSTPTAGNDESTASDESTLDVDSAINGMRDDLGDSQARALRALDGVETVRDLYDLLGFADETVEITLELQDAELFYLVESFDKMTQGRQAPEEFLPRASILDKLLTGLQPETARRWIEAGYGLNDPAEEPAESQESDRDETDAETDEDADEVAFEDGGDE